MIHSQKHSIITAAVIVLATLLASTANAAQTLDVRDEGQLHYTGSTGSLLREEGTATGTLPGQLYVHFVYNGSLTVTAQFTIDGHGWSLTGHGTGTLSSPNSASPSFRGPLTITGGSGRYTHAYSTGGELFGVFYRRSPKHKYALTVQTLGELHY
jgi:hypothetical protein